MPRARVDNTIERKVVDGFAFPLGVYPVEEMTPRQGYTVWFEPADADEEPEREDGEWEEWPDRYVFDVAISATRVEPLVRALLTLLPGRVYPILDVLGQDAYREVDSYVSYELIGQERFVDAIRRFRGFFFEDGMVGFGAMTEEPFIYLFVDEHKLVTIRVETSLRERVEQVLSSFDLEEVEEISGADAVTHEHRSVLVAPPDRPDLLTLEEIVEDLQDDWGLVLNVPPTGNADEEGNELGVTGWRCLIRWDPLEEGTGRPTAGRRYAEVLLTAGSLGQAEELAGEAIRDLLAEDATPEEEDAWEGEEAFIAMERVTPEELRALLAEPVETPASDPKGGGQSRPAPKAPPVLPEPPLEEERVWRARWLE